MWSLLARFILRFRAPLLVLIIALTAFMGMMATRARMKYDMGSAIPLNSPRYAEYQEFKKLFGEDGTMMVLGFEQKNFFEPVFFKACARWIEELRAIPGVVNVLSIPEAINLQKSTDSTQQKLETRAIFPQAGINDSTRNLFLSLPFYRNLLYNPETGVYLTALYLDKKIITSAERVALIKAITECGDRFGQAQNINMHYSGLPFIRTEFANSVQYEMKLILIASLLLTAIILFLFFRSFSAVLFSVLIVFSGVLWALGILHCLDYRISILTALVAPLVVVIGIPNCIYFLNKYHTQIAVSKSKEEALIGMVERMGIVTLFTNLTAAIGFGVFYFTESEVLREFGLVAGLSILVVFLISLFSIPAIFSYLPLPNTKHTRYLDNKFLGAILMRFEYWVLSHKKYTTSFWLILCGIALGGILMLKTQGYIVDDLPKEHAIYRDLKFFEKHFKGVMPLEIIIDTRKKNGISTLGNLQKLDAFCDSLRTHPYLGKPLSLVEAVKFARQAYYDGDSSNFGVPNSFDAAFLLPYLRMKSEGNTGGSLNQLIGSFVDSQRKVARISVGIEDIGSRRLEPLLKQIQTQAYTVFDSSRYHIRFTGTSIVFLEGSRFIINSLRDSLLLALVMIVFCMVFLFRSWRIVVISILTNMIPLCITAGVMGYAGIPLKPSTVLVFSIALGIAIDVTIRFLVNYKQDLPKYHFRIPDTVKGTIQETGISIIYTSLILAAGFVVFLVSRFDGTKALGYLTALTLLLAMISNLTILPALLVWFDKQKPKNNRQP